MTTTTASNRTLLRKLLVVAVAMFGFGFGMVPFYKKICEVAGLNNIARADAVTNSQVDAARWVTVEFDANVRDGMPWEFRPLQQSIRVHPGELNHATFEIRNGSDRPVSGQAIPSYGPPLAARFFKKLECFCFTQQTLAPGERKEMPVVFVIEKDLPDDVGTVTLSYTFFAVEGPVRRAG